MRVVFDENMPRALAQAMRILAEANAIGAPEPLEVLHALDVVKRGTSDIPLIEAVADAKHHKAALITTDKAMRTRQHERVAFTDTGCIGIILMGHWNHASLWDRARLSLIWWTTWIAQIEEAQPGSLWRSPWAERPKPLRQF